jgi:branched-chain amino acid transport system ATP-binding protein
VLLEVNEIVTLYGQSLVLDKVSLTVNEGEIVALLGRNGAGKTTTLRSIMGLTPPRKGSIKLRGIEITGRRPYEIARLGVGYAPDDRRIFPDLSSEENLLIAGRISKKNGNGWTVQRVYELFPALERVRSSKGGALSGGEQKMLAIGRGLMSNPELMLLDEPCEGLAPLVVKALAEAVVQIRQAGITVLVADQNIRFCRRIADRGYILEKGVIRYQGEMSEIWQNEEMVRKHLAV